MPSREFHNWLAKRLTGYDSKLIDTVNRDIDRPAHKLGPGHRVLNHDMDPLRKDSLSVTGGDPRKEVLRRIHIMADYDPLINTIYRYTEVQKNIRKLKKNGLVRKH